MSKVTNKQIADVFRAARPGIASGKYDFICCAILYTEGNRTLVDKACGIVQGRIQAGIRKVNRYEDWRTTLNGYLHYVHGVENAEMNSTDKGIKKMRITRLAWLDSLIEEFDKPGYYKQ